MKSALTEPYTRFVAQNQKKKNKYIKNVALYLLFTWSCPSEFGLCELYLGAAQIQEKTIRIIKRDAYK